MAELLLTHSYMQEFDPKQRKIGQPFAPLGTLYAAAILKQAGVDLCFYDAMFSQSTDQLIPFMIKENPHILVIYDDGFSYLSKMCLSTMREAAFRMIALGKSYGVEIIVCSSDAMDNYSLYLEKGANYVIIGEGEITLKELAGRLLKNAGKEIEDIQGIAWRRNGEIHVNKPRELIVNLDALPFPAWELLDVEKYRRIWKKKNRYFTMNMATTRGCPYHCTWCAKPVYGNHYNSRSPQNVAEEMLYLEQNFSPDRIWFADDIFGLKPGWLEEFAALKIRLPYSIQSRVDLLLEKQQIHSLVQSGCHKIWLGIESGSQKILDAMQKGTTIAQIYAVSPLIRDAGIEQAFFLQLGFPGETREDIRSTIRLITDLMPDDIGISVTYPLPGTKFFDSVTDQIKSRTNWKDSDDLVPLMRSTFSQKSYKPLHRYIHKHFRYKQAVFFLRMLFLEHSKLNRTSLRRIVLLPYYLIFSWLYKIILIRKGNVANQPL